MEQTEIIKLDYKKKQNIQQFLQRVRHNIMTTDLQGTDPNNLENIDITMIVKKQHKNHTLPQNHSQRKTNTTDKRITFEFKKKKQKTKSKSKDVKDYQKQNNKQETQHKSNKPDQNKIQVQEADTNNSQKDSINEQTQSQQSHQDQHQDKLKEQQQEQQQQQQEQQQLRRHISHSHIDIFPNIELTNVLSQKLMTLNKIHLPKQKSKTIKYPTQNSKELIMKQLKQRRRCSIDNQNLLSPRLKTLLNNEIRHQSIKDINKIINTKIKTQKQQQNDTQKQQKDNKNNKKEQENDDDHTRQQIDDGINQQDVQEGNQINYYQGQKERKSNTSIRDHQQFSIMKRNDNNDSLNKQQIYTAQQQQQQEITQSPQSQSDSITSSSKSSVSTSQFEPEDDSIYAIETKLNQCLTMVENNEIFKLEDYLYEFKNQYNYVTNAKILIKWRLLMAHCKQTKKEFERAAINYNSVIQIAKDNPKSLTIEPAQVYHRLAICYSEIAQYNKGILAFNEALNRYKRAKLPQNYAQCMNNLGTLYLQAQSLNLAEKCFLQSYHLKKSLHGKNSTQLLPSLFNIFQCNLLMKNYDQAEKILLVIQGEIISQIQQNQSNKLLYLGGLYRRKGKMQFLRGNLRQAQQNYLRSFQSLSKKYPYCMEFGQLMSCLGILKLQQKQYKDAKEYYDKAIMLMNFYCPKDSHTIHTLKKNLEHTVKMISEEKQGSQSRNSFFG